MQRVHRSEKQMHNEHKLITLDEKARCQVLLEISKLQGNLLHPEIQKNQRTLKLETVIGHRIFICLPVVVPHIKEGLFDRTTNLPPKSNG